MLNWLNSEDFSFSYSIIIYLRESKDLLSQTRKKVIEIVDKSAGHGGAINWTYVKDEIRNKIGDFLATKTSRRPMILPVVIEV